MEEWMAGSRSLMIFISSLTLPISPIFPLICKGGCGRRHRKNAGQPSCKRRFSRGSTLLKDLSAFFNYLSSTKQNMQNKGICQLFFGEAPSRRLRFSRNSGKAAIPASVTGLIHFPEYRRICIST